MGDYVHLIPKDEDVPENKKEASIPDGLIADDPSIPMATIQDEEKEKVDEGRKDLLYVV